MGPMNRSAVLGGVAWDAVEYVEADGALEVDLASGARAGHVELELAEPLERELVCRDPYLLDGTPYRMSFVNVPCGAGSVTIRGERMPGRPRRWTDDRGRLRSTAQVAGAERWAV